MGLSLSDAKLIADFMEATTKTLSSITKQINKMANFVETTAAAVADLQKEVDIMQAEVLAKLDAANVKITELIANMGTPEQQKAVTDALSALKADVKATLPPPATDAAQA